MTRCSMCHDDISDQEMVSVDGNIVCVACKEKSIETATAIKFFEPSGIREFIHTPMFKFMTKDEHNPVAEIPAIAGINGSDIILRPGFSLAVNQWQLQYGDQRHQKFSSLMKSMMSRTIVPPCPIVVVMMQVGNLQLNIDIIVRQNDVNVFNQWLGRATASQLT